MADVDFHHYQITKALFIGEGATVVSCIEHYLACGHKVQGIISADSQLTDWADENNIPFFLIKSGSSSFPSLVELKDHLENTEDVDYLFSVANSVPIPFAVIQLIKRSCYNFIEGPPWLNFHSCLLELKQPFVTTQWVKIEADISPSHVVHSQSITVERNDSGFSLAQKIFESAFTGFIEILADLETNQSPNSSIKNVEWPQYSNELKLGNTWIHWGMEASKIARRVRTLSLAPITNFLGLLKFKIGSSIYILHSCEALHDEQIPVSNGDPGQVLKVSEHDIVIATAKGALRVTEASTLTGEVVSFPDLAELAQDSMDGGGNDFDETQNTIAQKWIQSAHKNEPARLTQLLDSKTFEFANHWNRSSRNLHLLDPEQNEMRFYFGELLSIPIWAPHFGNHFEACSWLSGTLANFLFRIGGQSEITVPVSCDSFYPSDKAWNQLVCPFIPVHWNLDAQSPIQDGWWKHRGEILRSASLGPFLMDIFLRSELLAKGSGKHFSDFIQIYVGSLSNLDSFPSSPKLGLEQLPSGHFRFFSDPSYFSTETSQALSRAFESFFNSLSDSPGLEIPFLNLGRQGNVRRLDPEFDFDVPASSTILDFIESQAKRYPDSIAITDPASEITYDELWVKAGKIVDLLLTFKIAPGTQIGISMDRSVDYVISMVGILRTGCCFVPLAKGLPLERIGDMIDSSCIEHVIVENTSTSYLRDLTQKIKLITFSDLEDTHFLHRDTLVPAYDYASPAYIIFTSGSSGKPKPVLVGHRELVHHCLSFSKALSLSSETKVLQFAGLGFDVSIEEIIPTLAMGAHLVMRDDVKTASVHGFWEFVSKHQINLLNLPTAFWYALVDESKASHIPESVSDVIIGGEKVHSSYLKKWFSLSKNHITLWNGYGPTETTITASLLPILKPSEDLEAEDTVSIGYGLGCCDIFVIDHFGKPLPSGIPGEILITGQGVSRGYFGLAEQTRKSFVESPMIGASVEHGRAYKSGDYGCILSNNALQFLGRIDKQVKIRGFRIEIADVEKNIERHPEIQNAVVILFSKSSQDTQSLAGFIKLRNGSEAVAESIREDLKELMPEYMVPTSLNIIDTWPRNINGKIDTKHLTKLVLDNFNQHSDLTENPSFNETESKIYTIWSKALDRQNIGLNDSFFELGGDSLGAMKIMSQLKDQFGTSVSISHFYDNPSIKLLADFINKESSARGSDSNANKSLNSETDAPIIIHLNQSDKSHPLFILPGGAGGDIEIFIYRELARNLGDDLDIYTFQPLRHGMEKFPFDSVDDCVNEIYKELVKVQPQGPYFIIGDCIGSVLAFEIVSKLEAKGESISVVSLLDTQPGYHAKALNNDLKSPIQKLLSSNPWFGRLERYVEYGIGLLSTPPSKWSTYFSDLKAQRRKHHDMMVQTQSSGSNLVESQLPEALGMTFFELLCRHDPPKINADLDDYLPDSKKDMPMEMTWNSQSSGAYSQFFYSEKKESDYIGRTFDYLKERKSECVTVLRRRLIKNGLLKG